LKLKNTPTLIRKFNSTRNEKKYHHLIFVQHKKVTLIYFLFTIWKKNSIEENEEKLVAGVLGVAMQCAIHGAIV